MRPITVSIPLVAALVAAACAVPAGPGGPKPPGGGSPKPGATAAVPAAGVVVTGTVSAPAGVLSNHGAGVVSNGGGSLIGNNGGGLVSVNGSGLTGRGAYALTAAATPLVGFEVALADAAGAPVPGLAAVKTDGKGGYTITGVVPNVTYVVTVRGTSAAGKPAQLRTLVRVTAAGATADVTVATTLVSQAVLEDQGATLGEVNPARFRTASDATAEALASEQLPDLADTPALRALMKRLEAKLEALREALDLIRQDLKRLEAKVDDLANRLATPAPGGATATPGPTGGSPAPTTGTPAPGGGTPGPAGGTPGPGATATPASATTPAPVGPLGSLKVESLVGGDSGNGDGIGGLARFSGPTDVVALGDGTYAISDTGNGTIRLLGTDGGTTTIVSDSWSPRGMAWDGKDTLYVADGNGKLWAVRRGAEGWNKATVVTGGTSYSGGVHDETLEKGELLTGEAVAITGDGDLLVTDSHQSCVRLVDLDGNRNVTIAGGPIAVGSDFRDLKGIAAISGTTFALVDAGNHRICKLVWEKGRATVSTLAGGEQGHLDGPLAAARFDSPRDVAAAGGYLYVTEANRIRRIRPDGMVETVAGGDDAALVEGAATDARFAAPWGILVQSAQPARLLVVDQGNHRIRAIAP